MTAPVFMEGDLVTLHPLQRDDLEFAQEAINHPDVRRDLMAHGPKTMADEEEWYENTTPEEPTFILRADGERVGTIGMEHLNPIWGSVEIGYWIHPDHWGNGYCTDGVREVVRYAFEERRLNKVTARTYETNSGSNRVLQKVGFEREGAFRKEAFVEGEHVDVHRYGLLAEEWRES